MHTIPLTNPRHRGRVILGTAASALLLGGVALSQASIAATDAPTPIPIASPAPDAAETVAGRLVAVDPDGGTVELDVVEVLSGDEAQQAAVAAGDLPAGEDLPNDVYIRDVAGGPRILSVDAAMAVEIVDCSGPDGCALRPVPVADLLAGSVQAFNGDHAVWIATIDGGVVTGLSEVYLP